MDDLVNEAAGTFNFTNTSFLPDEAQTSLKMFTNANVQNINITSIDNLLPICIVLQNCLYLSCMQALKRS